MTAEENEKLHKLSIHKLEELVLSEINYLDLPEIIEQLSKIAETEQLKSLSEYVELLDFYNCRKYELDLLKQARKRGGLLDEEEETYYTLLPEERKK